MGKATIKDVARITGLSLGTISKYMNGGTVKRKNQEKIDAAVRELNYSVDEYARAMITNKTKTIGLLLPEFGNLFYAQVASELERELNKHGYAVAACESFYDKVREERSIRWLMSRRLDALVIAPCGRTAEDYVYLSEIGIPVIFIDQYIPGLNCEFFVVNNREICKQCIDFLMDHGHRQIAMVAAQTGLYTSDERVKGYYDAFAQRGIPVDESMIFHVTEDADEAYDVVKKLLKEKVCTALFAANFPNTIGSMFAINEARMSIPEELSFVGFDDMMFTRIFRPKLTIIDQPISEIAAGVTKRVFELMEQEVYSYQVNELKCMMKINASTARREN